MMDASARLHRLIPDADTTEFDVVDTEDGSGVMVYAHNVDDDAIYIAFPPGCDRDEFVTVLRTSGRLPRSFVN